MKTSQHGTNKLLSGCIDQIYVNVHLYAARDMTVAAASFVHRSVIESCASTKHSREMPLIMCKAFYYD